MQEQPDGRRWRLVLARRASGASVPASVRRFAKRARQRRLRTALPWLVALLVLALASGGVAIVYTTTLFGVRDVRVVGALEITPDQVRLAAAVRPGTPLARLEPRDVARRVAQMPAVASVRVRRDWPQTLVIRVTERTPVAVVERTGGFALLDAAGVAYRALDRRTDPPAGMLPLLRIADPVPGDLTTSSALKVLAVLSPEVLDRLVALVADSPTRIRLEMTDDRLVIWGDATENEAKLRVVTSLLAGPAKVLDVSAPSVVTIR